MWRWITNVRRLVGLFFKGEDPVIRDMAKRMQRIRELEETKTRSEQEFLQCIRQYNQEMEQVEEKLLKSQENARNVFKKVTEELLRAKDLRSRSDSTSVNMEDLYIWTQAVKEGKIEFDLNADIKACVKKLRDMSPGHADVSGAVSDQRTTAEATVTADSK